MKPTVILVLQLFFATHPEEIKLHRPVATIEECYKQAAVLMELREYEGRKLAAVGAGCVITLVHGDPA